MIARTSPPPASRRDLMDIPPEVLEQIYLLLEIPDRLRLARTCKLMRAIYRDSALLAYDFSLATLAYLDVRHVKDVDDDEGFSTPSDTDADVDVDIESDEGAQNYDDRRSSSSDDSVAVHLPARSIVLRNKLLIERERRWEELDPKVTVSRDVAGPAGVYELQEGVFLLCDGYREVNNTGSVKPTSIRLFKLPNADTLPDDHLSDALFAEARLSRGRGVDSRSREMDCESHKLGFPIADLTMDPTQDLIVVSEHSPEAISFDAMPPPHRLHLLSMSSFKPHPLAALPSLDFPPFAISHGSTRQLLQVMGDILVVLVSRYAPLWLGNVLPHIPGMESEEELVVWNWKSGHVLSRMALPENGWSSSLALLSPTSFMITSTSSISPVMSGNAPEPRAVAAIFPPVIQIYSFLPDPEHQTFPLQPLSAEHEDDSTSRPVLLAQLELPRFSDRVVVSSFDVRPDPAFPPGSSRPYPPSGHKSFTQDPSKGVLVFDLDVLEAPSETAVGRRRWPHRDYELFVLRETLVQYAAEGEARLRESRSAAAPQSWGIHRVEQIVPWSTWGVAHARFMDISMKRRAFVCSCSGYRFVSLLRNAFSSRGAGGGSDSDSEDEAGFEEERMPHISDVRIYDFSPYSVRKEQSRHRAILHDGEYPYQMPSRADLASGIATQGYYDDPAHGIRITEVAGEGRGPQYEIWRSIHESTWKRVVTSPTTLKKRGVFQEDVVTELPYVETIRAEGAWANGVMMDDQRIMLISSEESREGLARWKQKMTILCM